MFDLARIKESLRGRLSFQFLFWFLAFVLCLAMICLSFDYGITWDEWLQGHYGKLVLRYLLSGGTNHDFMSFAETAYLYGGLFDTITGFAYAVTFDNLHAFASSGLHDTVVGKSTQDLFNSGFFETRHVINTLFGFIAILCTGLLAKELGSWRTACLAILFIALSPRFLGHSMNNPKDIPFATAYILSIYFMVRFIKELPKPKLLTMVMISVGIAAAIGVRIGGLILIAYLFLFAGVVWLWAVARKETALHPLKLAGYVIVISLFGYFGGLICWPYGQMDPLRNPFLVFKTFSNFTGATGEVLFEGNIIMSDHLPWYYIPKWIGISSPLFVLAGLAIFLFVIPHICRRYNLRLIFIVLFATLFPIVSVMIRKPILYDGWRHLLFVYPTLIILSALPWEVLFQIVQRKIIRITLAVCLFALTLPPLAWMIRNHPHEYVYFNPLVGGINGAFGHYQTDYWGNSLRMGAEWLAHFHQKHHPNRLLIVQADGSLMSSFPYLRKIVGTHYLPFEQLPEEIQEKRGPDYAILLSKKWPGELLRRGGWPPRDTIHEIKAGQITLCAVVKNPKLDQL